MFDEKKFMPPCGSPAWGSPPMGTMPPHKPAFTLTEDMNHTIIEMRETMARLLAFEERLKREVENLMQHLSTDNVLFKNTFAESHRLFLEEVKNEVNAFESNVDNSITLFKNEIETNYANLATDTQNQIATALATFTNSLNAYKEELNKTYDDFRDAIESRLAQYNSNYEQAFNGYTTSVNSRLATMEQKFARDYATFTSTINETVSNFKVTWANEIDARLDGQDSIINDAVLYMKTNLLASMETVMNGLVADGVIETITTDTYKKVKECLRNVKDFGAVGDGVTDDTDAIKSAIKASAGTVSGWTPATKIYFPNGKYLVSDTLIDGKTGVTNCMFTFEGETSTGVSIITDDTNTVLFDNTGVFGFTTFNKLTFVGNNHNTFLNNVGGGTGNAQSMRFHECRFNKFHTIINQTGTTMTSEVTFFDCKITACGTSENPCEIFIMNNPQGVNWRLFATDIESFRGTLFHYIKGASVYYYQGSIIPLEGAIFTNEGANFNDFGGGNLPCCTMYGTRFELRDTSKLFDLTTHVRFDVVFNECGMGGANYTADTPVMNFGKAKFNVVFNNCRNMPNFTMGAIVETSHGRDVIQSYIALNNCDIPLSNFIENSTVEIKGSGDPCPVVITCNGRKYVKGGDLSKTYFNSTTNLEMRKISVLKSDTQGGSYLSVNGNARTQSYNAYGYVGKIYVTNIGTTAYGDANISLVVLADDEEITTGTVPCNGGTTELTVNKYVKKLTIKTDCDYSDSITAVAPVLAVAEILC